MTLRHHPLRVLYALLVLWLVTVCLLIGPGCGPSQVRRQVVTAEGMALAANAALPLTLDAYRRECAAVIDRADAYEQAAAAVDQCNSRWSGVWAAYESARGAHDLWRSALAACRARVDAGTCGPTLGELEREFVASLLQWRCAVRAIGRGDLDKLPGTPACAGDAGHE